MLPFSFQTNPLTHFYNPLTQLTQQQLQNLQLQLTHMIFNQNVLRMGSLPGAPFAYQQWNNQYPAVMTNQYQAPTPRLLQPFKQESQLNHNQATPLHNFRESYQSLSTVLKCPAIDKIKQNQLDDHFLSNQVSQDNQDRKILQVSQEYGGKLMTQSKSISKQSNEKYQNEFLTKNIPKNISKGLKKYLISQKPFVLKCFKNDQTKMNQFLTEFRKQEIVAYSVKSFQTLWKCFDDPEFNKVLRLVGQLFKMLKILFLLNRQKFLKKDLPSYIYNSHIKSKKMHLSYKYKFISTFKEDN